MVRQKLSIGAINQGWGPMLKADDRHKKVQWTWRQQKSVNCEQVQLSIGCPISWCKQKFKPLKDINTMQSHINNNEARYILNNKWKKAAVAPLESMLIICCKYSNKVQQTNARQ